MGTIFFLFVWIYFFILKVNLQGVPLKTGPLERRNHETILFRLVFGWLFADLFQITNLMHNSFIL